MKLNLDSFRTDHFLIKSHNSDSIQVNDLSFSQSVIVCLDQAPQLWTIDSISKLTTIETSALLQDKDPEIVLIGTGKKHVFPSAATLIPLLEANIGYEVMDTAAACRTYNVLAGEGRRVVAGLILPG